MEEEGKFEARGADEGERDHLAHKQVEVWSRTIRWCLDAWCRLHEVTLQQTEDCKIICKVSCRWQEMDRRGKKAPAMSHGPDRVGLWILEAKLE